MRSQNTVDPRNRLNDLDARSWLKFQKSWFVLSAQERSAKVAEDFILFFTKKRTAEGRRARIGLIAENAAALAPVVRKLDRETVVIAGAAQSSDSSPEKPLDYALIDLCDVLADNVHFLRNISWWRDGVQRLATRLKPRAYLTIFIRNLETQGRLMPWAWHLGLAVSRLLVIKDEKIGCLSASGALHTISSNGDLVRAANGTNEITAPFARTRKLEALAGWKTRQDVIYCLNFRREETDGENTVHHNFPLSNPFSLAPATRLPSTAHAKTVAAKIRTRVQASAPGASSQTPASLPPSWFVPKPPPREKHVLLHPAKFPESLVTYFLHEFSKPGERIFDPMGGTGSTLIAALAAKRQAYGVELNRQFHGIAKERIHKLLAGLPHADRPQWRLTCGDAASSKSYRALPETFDYVLTSPPYWDMLRMKGAETQQKRKQAGLLQFYSEDRRDLGNRSDYEQFLADLVKIYLRVAERLAAGRYMTVIVKNVKKRGKIYPLAWDLALRLGEHLILCHEQFWCQDDQRLAPFGYRYAWVSNTFHHYCLHFRKPG